MKPKSSLLDNSRNKKIILSENNVKKIQINITRYTVQRLPMKELWGKMK